MGDGLLIDAKKLLGHGLNDYEVKNDPGHLYVKGSMDIPLPHPRVSIVGSRQASKEGLADARKIAKVLVENDVVIVSGLARGIDTAAHRTAIECGGRTIAVIGTPLNKTYPKENFELQQEMMKNHLVISQYPVGHTTMPKDFVLRNKTMALISDATVIVEAGDSSGSLHHGWASLRMGRPLFICKAVKENTGLEWPDKMSEYGAMVLEDPSHVLEHVPDNIKVPELFSK